VTRYRPAVDSEGKVVRAARYLLVIHSLGQELEVPVPMGARWCAAHLVQALEARAAWIRLHLLGAYVPGLPQQPEVT